MLALLPTDGSDPLVKVGEAPDPPTAPDEALIQVEAFSINRGETFLLEHPRDGWRPGRDASGRVIRAAAFDFFAQTGATIRHFDHDDSVVPDSRDLATLVHLVTSERLQPEIGVVEDWTQTASVLADLRERRVRGNEVLRIDHHTQSPITRPGE